MSTAPDPNATTIAGISLEQLLVASTIGAIIGIAVGETLKSAARAWVRQSRPRH